MLTKNRKINNFVSIIAVFLIIPCILGSFLGFTKADSESGGFTFRDVSENAYYYDAVRWAYENNIMNGTTDRKFSPDSICTRADLVTCIWRMMGEPEPVSKRKYFDDIDESDYYYKAVMWALKSGITYGTGPNRFAPSKECTYAEALTMIWRAEGSHWRRGQGEWYTDANNWAEMMNLSCNMLNGPIDPNALCPRRDVATLIYRSLKMNSVEEWMKEYKGRTLGELIENGEICRFAGMTDIGNRYYMTDYFGIYLITDGSEKDSKIVGAQFYGSNWVTDYGISPLMKGISANQNFNNWEKVETSDRFDGAFYTYRTDNDGNDVKVVWQISNSILSNWIKQSDYLTYDEYWSSYNDLIASHKYAAIGYVYTYYVTYRTETVE